MSRDYPKRSIMGWSIQLALPLLALLFCSQCIPVQGRGRVPFLNSRTAKVFMSTFVRAATHSGAFSDTQLNEMEVVCDTLSGSMDKMLRSGRSSMSMLQAINMAFASSVADIAVSRGGSFDMNQKTNAVTDSLSQAYLRTIGVVDNQFIDRIRQLMN